MEDAGLAPVLQIVGTSLGIGCVLAAAGFALVYLIRFLTAALHSVARIVCGAFGFIAKLTGSLRLPGPKVAAAPTKQHKPAKKKSAPAKQSAVPKPPPPPPPAKPAEKPDNHGPVQPSLKKVIAQLKHKPASGVLKGQAIGRHRLDLNTLKGHGDSVSGIAFSSSGSSLASACSDGYVRIFKIEDASSKSQHCLKLKVPPGGSPADVSFGESEEEVVVVTQDIMGADLVMFGTEGKATAAAKKSAQPEQKWSKKHIHGMKNVLMCAGARGANGALIATCSEGTDVKVWTTKGDCVATVDTNQLRNSMAAVSPDGRFLLAAAFTGDVKIWEINYGKDGKIRDVTKVMLLKGHKSAVTWACFTWDSQRVITASKDGSWRIWNINVRYHMDEDPKCLRVFPIQQTGQGELAQFDMISVSPDNRVLAVTQAAALKWLSTETGDVLETATSAHDDLITGLCWAPQTLQTDQGRGSVLATASLDKKVKLWLSP